MAAGPRQGVLSPCQRQGEVTSQPLESCQPLGIERVTDVPPALVSRFESARKQLEMVLQSVSASACP